MQQATLELAMIVRDGAATLSRCLESVAPVTDRITVGDTGSTDASIQIARSFGARVIDVPWREDFSLARNQVLTACRSDWILVLDADEMLDSEGRERVRKVIARPGIGAYDVWRWNYLRATQIRSGEQGARANPGLLAAAKDYPAYALSLNTRLFRRHPEVYFERCVHETVAQRVDALGWKRAEASFVIHHFGQAEDEEPTRREKNELYQRLGLRKLRERPDDAHCCFELGLGELEHFRRPAAALQYFERACELDKNNARARLFLGMTQCRLGRYSEALESLAQAQRLKLDSPVLHETRGDVWFHVGEYDRARGAYEQALTGPAFAPLTTAKLGAALVRLGFGEAGLRRIEAAIASNPEFAELYDMLSAAAVLCGNLRLAAHAAETRLSIGEAEALHYQLAAEIREALGEPAAALRLALEGIEKFPADCRLRRVFKSVPHGTQQSVDLSEHPAEPEAISQIGGVT
uniref:Glycosyltransferase 2-like domain-containing protein n=1 Tax=mine drainage metagenome TaxID=410659 RepID=E6QID0_9ZZZZ